jgi:hypothetical protein
MKQVSNPELNAQITASVTELSGNIKNAIGSGNFAANLADKVTNPLGAVLSSVKASTEKLVASAKGAAAGAFSAIKDGLTKLKGGIPQNLTALNQLNAAAQDAADTLASETSKISANFTLADAAKITDVVTKGANALGNAGLKLPIGELTALSGGITAISKVVTNLKDASLANAVGSSVTGLKDTLQTEITSVTGLSDAANLNSVAGLKDALQKGLASLTGIGTKAMASLNSAIQSIGSGGPKTLQMPTVAIDTIDRSGILKQTAALFNDLRIPLPATTPKDPSAPAVSNASDDDKIAALKAEARQLQNDLPKFNADREAAYLRLKQGLITWEEYAVFGKKPGNTYDRLADITDEIRILEFGL